MTEHVDEPAALAAAEQIGREIAATAIWMGERCNWVGAMPDDAGGGRITLTFRALGADLYGGTAGVGVFLAELAAATGNDDVRRTALGALRHAASRTNEIPPNMRDSLYAGQLGVALAVGLAARALGDAELDAIFEQLATGAETHPDAGAEYDLMSGSAGAVTALLALRAQLDEPDPRSERLLDAALAHGQTLLDRAARDESGISWPARSMPNAPRLTGLSHGAAGIATALLELASGTGDERYRSAAEAAFRYERGLFDPAAGNWPDLRAVPGQPQGGGRVFATFWCHGAPGGALARLRALELGLDAPLDDELRAALATTEAWIEAALATGTVNYSLCHGLAGNAEVLEECSAFSASASALAHRVAAAGIDAYGDRPTRWPSGAHGGATPGLFLGLAGIGRFYLRLARPSLPSLLILRPTPIGITSAPTP